MKGTKMLFLKVVLNYKKAYTAWMSMTVLEQAMRKNKSKNKHGPDYLYGKVGQVACELVKMFNEEEV